MLIFDSKKNNAWIGRNISMNNNGLLLLKNAVAQQDVNIASGIYSLYVPSISKNNSDYFYIDLIDSRNITIKNIKVYVLDDCKSYFDIMDGILISKIRIYRDSNYFNFINISFIAIEKVDKTPEVMHSLISKPLRNNNQKSIAFIIPDKNYGDEKYYIENLINNLELDIDVSIIYTDLSLNNFNISKKYNTFHLHKLSELSDHIIKYDYNYLIFYNSLSIYNTLSSLKSRGSILSRIIEIYFSNLIATNKTSSLKSRKNLYKMIFTDPRLFRGIEYDFQDKELIPFGVDTKLFSKKSIPGLKETLGFKKAKVIGTTEDSNLDFIISLSETLPNFKFLILNRATGGIRFIDRKFLSPDTISNVSIQNFYNICDAMVLSPRGEGNHLVAIESMASEVPVFTTDAEGINFLIKDTITGFVMPNNINDASKKIIDNIDSSKLVAHCASEYVYNNFNIEKNLSDTISLLD